jgi:hypothetical protein
MGMRGKEARRALRSASDGKGLATSAMGFQLWTARKAARACAIGG